MTFEEKVALFAEGHSFDEIAAIEASWDSVPEPLTILLSPDGRMYLDGQLIEAPITVEDECAWLDGAPVIITIPKPNGGFTFHPQFGPDSVNAARAAAYEEALEKSNDRWNNTPYDQRTTEEKIEDGDAEPEQEPTPQELCSVRWNWDMNFVTSGIGEWRPQMLRCICGEEDCPRRRPLTREEWALLHAANYTHDVGTVALMQSLVDSAKSGVK